MSTLSLLPEFGVQGFCPAGRKPKVAHLERGIVLREVDRGVVVIFVVVMGVEIGQFTHMSLAGVQLATFVAN